MPPTTLPAQPTPPGSGARPATMRRRAPLALGMLCAAVLSAAIAVASGCGESNSTPAAANPPANTTTTTPATTTSTSQSPTGATTTTTSDTPSHHERSALAKERARAAFQSLANAKPAPKPTPAQRANRPISDIPLTSPDIDTATNTLPTENTCYGADRHPTLRWKNIPPGTAEIAITILSTKPVNNQLFYDWAITGIPPTLHEIPAGQTPPGATTIPNSYGHPTYNICPTPNTNETYVIIISALPTTLHPTPTTTTIHTQIQHTTHHTGLLITTYHHT